MKEPPVVSQNNLETSHGIHRIKLLLLYVGNDVKYLLTVTIEQTATWLRDSSVIFETSARDVCTCLRSEVNPALKLY